MIEKTLFKYFLILSLSGIFILIIISNIIEPKLSKINDIDRENIEEFVKIRGDIIKVRNIGNITLLDIKDETGEINGIIYENVNIMMENNTETIGKVINYENELEIEIRKIIRGN